MKHTNAVEKYYEKKCESKFSDYRWINIYKSEKYVNIKTSSLPASKKLANLDKTDLRVSSDYNSLHRSAMLHLHSKWPKKETAKAIDITASGR